MPKRQKRARPYVGSKSSETGCAYGPHETHGTTELAGEVSLAAGTVPDHRTQRAYGSAACRASEALREALGVERPRDRLHRMTPRDARRHIPRNGHLFNAQDRPGRPRRAGLRARAVCSLWNAQKCLLFSKMTVTTASATFLDSKSEIYVKKRL